MFEWPIRRAKWFLSFIFSGVACLPRKHLYPMGPKSYPTLAQKHLNGALSWNNIVSTCYKQVLSINILFLVVFHDSGAWTQGSCCACKVATNCHSGSSCCRPSQWACWVALTDIWRFLVWMLRDVPRFVFLVLTIIVQGFVHLCLSIWSRCVSSCPVRATVWLPWALQISMDCVVPIIFSTLRWIAT